MTGEHPPSLPQCSTCGVFYVPRPQHSVYGHLTVCRACNGERPHGPAPWPAKRPARAPRRAKAAVVAAKVVSIKRKGGGG